MDVDDFALEFESVLHPEPDDDGIMPREFPHARLRDKWGLRFDYMEHMNWEGSSTHRFTRLCPERETDIRVLTRNHGVSESLFRSALRLMGDSIVEYGDKPDGAGEIRFYPPIILTFWSAFETYIRYVSELFIRTSVGISEDVVRYLREQEPMFKPDGELRLKARFQRPLDRYAMLLSHAYGYQVDRGSQFWQALESARRLRDYYTHLDVAQPRSISSDEVLTFMESILLGLIVPSSYLQRSLMIGQYWLYDIWAFLSENCPRYTEKPFFLDWALTDAYMFHCNFETVDINRFPSFGDRPFGDALRNA